MACHVHLRGWVFSPFPKANSPLFFDLSFLHFRWYRGPFSIPKIFQQMKPLGRWTLLHQGLVNKTHKRSGIWGPNWGSTLSRCDLGPLLNQGGSTDLGEFRLWFRHLYETPISPHFEGCLGLGKQELPPSINHLAWAGASDLRHELCPRLDNTSETQRLCCLEMAIPPPPMLIYSKNICVFWIIIFLWNI